MKPVRHQRFTSLSCGQWEVLGGGPITAFKRNGRWVAKFTLDGTQYWVPGGPWDRKSHAVEAERRHRDRLRARRTDETCASFADRWLEEWPRPEASTQRLYAAAEIARLRAFLAAIAEAIDAEHRVAVDLPDLRLAAVHALARDAADPTAPVPGRVAQLWNEQAEGQ